MDWPCAIGHHTRLDRVNPRKGAKMARILKALGLTLTAVFALSAVSASGASAAEFTSFNTNTSLHESGTYTGTGSGAMFSATPGGFIAKCAHESYAGSSTTGTEATPTAVPTYIECTVKIGMTVFNAEIRTNKCEYKFHIDKEKPGSGGDEFEGHISIVNCEKGKSIEIEVPKTGCIDTVGEANNTAINGVVYKNTTAVKPTDIDIIVNANNVHSETNKGLLQCGVTAGTHATGTFVGEATVRAFNTAKEQIDLTVM
jgi:hypothetical protein